jgi:NADPH-dependent 2,4-dienoyl-CoA reductase/sulfur reductase-like enzyme/nitrite reductase/ring-hydroxylating ferredoxin subunit
MAEEAQETTGPDLTLGVPIETLADCKPLAGHVGDDAVLLVRRGDEHFAIGGTCTHYNGPLAQGLIVDDTVRCPWHHACFSLRTGEALHAPALSPVACWSTELRDGKVFVGRKVEKSPQRRVTPGASAPRRIVIVGGGAAGFAAAEMLRRQQWQGDIVMLSDDDAPPVDRPNLSKDYLAGTAPEEWVPLRDDAFYAEHGIDLRLRTQATDIDVRERDVVTRDGARIAYDRLLLATGAEPVRLSLPGMDLPHVHTLRTLADSRAIIARAATARRAVVMGASFIGLEVAASLRARGLDVHVVAPDKRPMERVLGPQMGDFVRRLHEEHGVVFHLEDTATAVDAFLETSAPGVLAAGDIARWPDARSGSAIRVEHWVVAERQGQAAALNMLGAKRPFDAVPFFWSQHYDVPINYVGHAEAWDDIAIDGDIAARDCVLRYRRGGRVLAVASIYRDVDSLEAEVAMERQAAA